MTKEKIQYFLSQIIDLDKDAEDKAKEKLDTLAKPPSSLGRLEDIAITLAGIYGDITYCLKKRCIIIMSSDNGVVEEQVASAPSSVTYHQTINFTKGITGVAVLAKEFHTDLIVVDVGVKEEIHHSQIMNKKIRPSTWNIAKGSAMTYEEAVKAILIGIETAIDAVDNGYQLLGCGEMGIGNTTTSSAVLCALTGMAVSQVTGKGGGLTESDYLHKLEVIQRALEINQPNRADPIEVLAKVGGFDLAAMTGVYIGAAYKRVPIVIDGFISMVAAVAAFLLNPLVKNYMFASHNSYERGYCYAAKVLGVEPYLNLNMRLGEGSGCPLMFAVMDAAKAIFHNMGTFEQADIDDSYLDEIRQGDHFSIHE